MRSLVVLILLSNNKDIPRLRVDKGMDAAPFATDYGA
jgi:hypothetical protein